MHCNFLANIYIKLIRRKTTLSLSQKTEKGSTNLSRVNELSSIQWTVSTVALSVFSDAFDVADWSSFLKCSHTLGSRMHLFFFLFSPKPAPRRNGSGVAHCCIPVSYTVS